MANLLVFHRRGVRDTDKVRNGACHLEEPVKVSSSAGVAPVNCSWSDECQAIIAADSCVEMNDCKLQHSRLASAEMNDKNFANVHLALVTGKWTVQHAQLYRMKAQQYDWFNANIASCRREAEEC